VVRDSHQKNSCHTFGLGTRMDRDNHIPRNIRQNAGWPRPAKSAG
jgi:hypothetical protein